MRQSFSASLRILKLIYTDCDYLRHFQKSMVINPVSACCSTTITLSSNRRFSHTSMASDRICILFTDAYFKYRATAPSMRYDSYWDGLLYPVVCTICSPTNTPSIHLSISIYFEPSLLHTSPNQLG